MDELIRAEIPNAETEPELYDIITKANVHHCGVGQMCWDNDRKIRRKHFPYPFMEQTTLDPNGKYYYRRRESRDYEATVNNKVTTRSKELPSRKSRVPS